MKGIKREEGRSTGLEPATSGSTNLRSNQLSYDRQMTNVVQHESYSSQFQNVL